MVGDKRRMEMEHLENQEVVVEQETTETEQETKVFTEEEVNKKVQAEADKRVNQALEKAKAKWEQDFKEKLQKEKSEAEKLASMTEEEKFKAQLEAERKQFEEERKTYLMERMEYQATRELANVGLPINLTKYVVAETAEEVKTNIDTFKALWEQSIEQAVNERLKGKTPVASSTSQGTVSKEEFAKMTMSEKDALYKSNPELYKQLRNK